MFLLLVCHLRRPNTQPGWKASKRGRPRAVPSSHAQKTPAEMTTALIVDDGLQSAIDSAIDGILSRIVHMVSTLLGGEGISKEVTNRSGGQTAHSSLAEVDRPLEWGVETQDPDLTFLSSLAGRTVPTAQVAHDSMVGAQGQGFSTWGRTWAGPEPAGTARGPPHQRNQVWPQ